MTRTLTAGPFRDGIGRVFLVLAALTVAWTLISPSNAAVVDQPEGGLTEPVCHDEATVLLVAAQFGTVLVLTGKKAPVIAAAAWRAIEKVPPVANKLYIVIGKDGLVRLFAVNRGCVRRSMAATFKAFRAIFGDAMEQFQEARQ